MSPISEGIVPHILVLSSSSQRRLVLRASMAGIVPEKNGDWRRSVMALGHWTIKSKMEPLAFVPVMQNVTGTN